MHSSRAVWLVPAVLLVLSFIGPADAARKYRHWFARSDEDFDHISRSTCNATFNRYEETYDSLGGALWIEIGARESVIYEYCRDHMSCVLDNIVPAKQASLNAAGVVLGLLPTLLAVLSPSIAELALLSIHRPILSTLISIGSPGVLQTRVFEYEDPAVSLDLPDSYNAITRTALALGPWDRATAGVISICEYLLVLASGVNVIYLSIELGIKSILSWGCTRSWPAMLWAVFPIVIHTIGACGYRLTLDPSTRHKEPPVILHKQGSFFTEVARGSHTQIPMPNSDAKSQSSATTTTTDIPLLPIASSAGTAPAPAPAPSSSAGSRLLALIKRELLPCASHPTTVMSNRLPLTGPSTRAKIGILLNCLAGFLSCMHLLYGTVVFASLNFIDVLDAVREISMRFLASSVVCRLVILVEIAGMRGARMRMVAEGRAQADAVGGGGAMGGKFDGDGNDAVDDGQGVAAARRRRGNGRIGLR